MNSTSLPPGPSTPRPLQTIRWIARPAAMMEDCRRRYGDMFTLRIAHEGTWVFLADPEAVKQVFTGDPRVLHAGEANVVLLPMLGHHSVLLLDEAAHMSQRKLMLPPFHGERMRGYEQTMAEVAREEIERWSLGEPHAVRPATQAITLEVIMRTVFGVQDGERRERLRRALREALEWGSDPRRMALLATLGPQRVARAPMFRNVREPADELIYDEIRLRRGADDLEERDDVFSLLLQARHEDGSPMSDDELRDELMTLLVAGHETTASALAWAVERLVRHPQVLARAREESEAGGDEYIDAICKETLRLRPILSLVLRRLKQPMEIGGRLLPAGVTVAPCIYLIHRRPDVYPEPLAFRPERFLEGQGGTYTWIPFGGGVRRCLGASFALFEMRVVLRELLARLELRAPQARSERMVRRAITLVPERGGEVVAERRPTRESAPARVAA
ncbi:MAG TPA: cytochrome P450 [Thermoleophilaceae bacterium]|nr:cytochrome P450 [Thermoleophilaceae bacterium]